MKKFFWGTVLLTSISSNAYSLSNDFCKEERRLSNKKSKTKILKLLKCFSKPFNFFNGTELINLKKRYQAGQITIEEFLVQLDTIKNTTYKSPDFSSAGENIISTVLEQEELFKKYAHINRFELLLEYSKVMKPYFATKKQIRSLDEYYYIYDRDKLAPDHILLSSQNFLKQFYVKNQLIPYTEGLHFPLGLSAMVLVNEQNFSKRLSPRETPHFYAAYLGNVKIAEQIKILEKQYKELDLANFEMPEYVSAPDAVRVSFVDGGFNYLYFPDLMGFNTNSPIYDVVDNDSEVYATSMSNTSTHGVSTSGSFLSLIAHRTPYILENRKLDLGFVKIFGDTDITTDRTRYSLSDKYTFELLTGNVDIVSRSVSTVYVNEETEKALKNIDFLYVIAAGNSGRILGNNPLKERKQKLNGCYSGSFAENRPADKILCVGSIKKGITYDFLANYSNVGDIVDVYTYESFLNLCLKGTSCATPGITAAAAIVKEKYPELTVEELKETIINASEMREFNSYHHPVFKAMNQESVLLPFFDPETMMDKAFIEAEKILGL